MSGVQVVKPASNGVPQTNEDTPMQSSPFMSSSMPNQEVEEEVTGMRVMTLAREEHLEGTQAPFTPYSCAFHVSRNVSLRSVLVVKAKYESISSVHIYSLEPGTLQVPYQIPS